LVVKLDLGVEYDISIVSFWLTSLTPTVK
jgi:hypothetical protein